MDCGGPEAPHGCACDCGQGHAGAYANAFRFPAIVVDVAGGGAAARDALAAGGRGRAPRAGARRVSLWG